MFSKIVEIHNTLSDKDFIWFPFQKLKPLPHEQITFKHTLFMTSCFAFYFTLGFAIREVISHSFVWSQQPVTFLYCLIGFLFWFNTVTRPIWNIRANKLSSTKSTE